jgi:hypothetical protein
VPLTSREDYEFKRKLVSDRLKQKQNAYAEEGRKSRQANEILKNGSVLSSLFGQDHSGKKEHPIMIGSYNLANNPIMRATNGVVDL